MWRKKYLFYLLKKQKRKRNTGQSSRLWLLSDGNVTAHTFPNFSLWSICLGTIAGIQEPTISVPTCAQLRAKTVLPGQVPPCRERLGLVCAKTVLLANLRSQMGFPEALVVKNSPANAGDLRDKGSIPSPRVGNGSPLQYSCLENPMDRGAW